MEKKTYKMLESYMRSCMSDSVHDGEHINRVLYGALEIAKTEKMVDYDVLIGACLLHDIARKEQYENPKLCHAIVGGDKAYGFLMENGFGEEYAGRVRECIQSHRFRENHPPESIEAKILFDADKLDSVGALGIARTLMYVGNVSEPIYSVLPDGRISDGTADERPSFFQEYKYKLEKLYSRFYTVRGRQLAQERQEAAIDFYRSLYEEVNVTYQHGKQKCQALIR